MPVLLRVDASWFLAVYREPPFSSANSESVRPTSNAAATSASASVSPKPSASTSAGIAGRGSISLTTRATRHSFANVCCAKTTPPSSPGKGIAETTKRLAPPVARSAFRATINGASDCGERACSARAFPRRSSAWPSMRCRLRSASIDMPSRSRSSFSPRLLAYTTLRSQCTTMIGTRSPSRTAPRVLRFIGSKRVCCQSMKARCTCGAAKRMSSSAFSRGPAVRCV